jgi:predicted metal-dependent hydrolase
MDYHIIRSNRRTMAMEITKDAEVVIRAPYRASRFEIDRFIDKNYRWMVTHLEKMERQKEARDESPYGPITPGLIRKYTDLAKKTIPPRVEQYARQMGVTYNRITIRCQKTRWGSCSSKGNLNFNCLLMLTPAEVQDYVIVHELAHRKEMNHSSKFWAVVGEIMPDYKTKVRWLKEHGGEIINSVQQF